MSASIGSLPPGASWWGGGLRPVGGATPGSPAAAGAGAARPEGAAPDFAATLDRTLAPLRFSGHAQQRLELSGRQLSDSELQRLGQAVDRLAAKGARESLLLLPDLALVVSVPSRTVITALDGSRVRDGVFTGIDSAAVL